ncbi:MAG: pantoate--beta-alanine ligase, partial [Thermodesulfobacteriaceae bacterium]|nr:pantoate--beta-alanine ligase [Thermodesulfobacteriaceae bacterium]
SLYKALNLAEELIKRGEKESKEIKKKLKELISSFPYTQVQYIELVDPETLEPVEKVEKPILCALAVWVGKTRLIDNKIISP